MARSPKQNANLKPIKKGELSSEEAKRRGSNGGKKSGEVRREKRDARDAARYLLNLTAKGQMLENVKGNFNIAKDDKPTNMDVLMARLFVMAYSGNLEALEAYMKYAGMKPEENRNERESLAADSRRERELDAKLQALGQAPEGATMAVGLGNEDGESDVLIYMPKPQSEDECLADEEETEGKDTPDTGE